MTSTNSRLRPVPLGLRPSFGFGDRMGVATPGHIEAMRRAGDGIAPIFPQQSIREMTRTKRSPEGVMADAVGALSVAGWKGDFGADADHLKTPADVDRTLAAGFTFFTIDPSDAVDAQADGYTEEVLREKFAAIRDQIDWFDLYNGKQIGLSSGTAIDLDEEAVMRAAVKYGIALNKGIELADYIRNANEQAKRDYEIELSVDETDNPTTLAEHYIIADQCLRRRMKLVSLAPRFVGNLEKGVDYIGDVAELERSLRDHQAIAGAAGAVQIESAFGVRQAVDLSGAGPRDRRPVPCEDGRHIVLGSVARRGRSRCRIVPPHLRIRPRAVRHRQGDVSCSRHPGNGARAGRHSRRSPTRTDLLGVLGRRG